MDEVGRGKKNERSQGATKLAKVLYNKVFREREDDFGEQGYLSLSLKMCVCFKTKMLLRNSLWPLEFVQALQQWQREMGEGAGSGGSRTLPFSLAVHFIHMSKNRGKPRA